jgi:hypothetical protein
VSADEVVRLGDPPDAEPSRKRSLLIAVGVAVLVLVGGALLLLSM